MSTEMHNFSHKLSFPSVKEISFSAIKHTYCSIPMELIFCIIFEFSFEPAFNSFQVPLIALNKIFTQTHFVFVWELWFYLSKKNHPLHFWKSRWDVQWVLLGEPGRAGSLTPRHVFLDSQMYIPSSNKVLTWLNLCISNLLFSTDSVFCLCFWFAYSR